MPALRTRQAHRRNACPLAIASLGITETTFKEFPKWLFSGKLRQELPFFWHEWCFFLHVEEGQWMRVCVDLRPW
jgi:hypothetical protein